MHFFLYFFPLTEYTLHCARIPLWKQRCRRRWWIAAAPAAAAHITAHKIGAQHWPFAGAAATLQIMEATGTQGEQRQTLAIDLDMAGWAQNDWKCAQKNGRKIVKEFRPKKFAKKNIQL